ncbi:MAG: GMP synthase [Bacteroidetes bacterium]|nr:GMP synthase [Bacteroidota bacterium]
MNTKNRKKVKVAILDLYEGVPNQGMRCIREILNQFSEENDIDLQTDEFEVRIQKEVPGLDYDIYISSGGPGSPLETEGSEWEKVFFGWLNRVEKFNDNETNLIKKQVFFICHSFQLVCRHYKVADVTKRKSTAFGVFPIHYLTSAENEPVFEGLKDPFYAVDSRDFQVIQPHQHTLKQMGASILAIEKARPHVPLERAVMAIRFNENMIGTQFHPEADAIGMSLYLQTEEKKKTVIENHGEEKWRSMIEHLNDPDKIMSTYAHILPNFLSQALDRL